MKNINLSPYLTSASPDGLVSSVPNRGDVADCLQELLERAIGIGSDGRLMEDVAYVLRKHCYVDEIRWHLRLCKDTRNARDVAGELAWAPTRVIEQVVIQLDKMILLRV